MRVPPLAPHWLALPLFLLARVVAPPRLLQILRAALPLLSVLFVRYEDTQQAWTLAARLLFYLSPVLFPIELVPESVARENAVLPMAEEDGALKVIVSDPLPRPRNLCQIVRNQSESPMKSFSSSSFASDNAVALEFAADAVKENPYALFTDFQ